MSSDDELRNCRQGKRILKKRVAELERALRAEAEQHEAFYVQSGIKSRIHERGIAAAYALAGSRKTDGKEST